MSTEPSNKNLWSTKAAAGAAVLMGEEKYSLPPFRRGLTVVACLSMEGRRLTRETLIRAALTGGDELPIRMPKGQKVTFLCAGSRREQDLMKVSLNSLANYAREMNYDHQQVISADPIDWTGPGGLALVKQKLLEVDGWLILEHASGPNSNPINFEGLLRIQQDAKRLKKWVMLIMVNPRLQDTKNFSRIADEYLEITLCEPDPGWDEAIVIDCVALTQGLGHALGKVMSLARQANGHYETQTVPFVSNSLQTRLMVILRATGKTLERIGRLVGLDKSGVSRQLKGMPAIRDPKLSNSALRQWYEACGVSHNTTKDSGDKELPAAPETEKVVAKKKKKTRNDRNTHNRKR